MMITPSSTNKIQQSSLAYADEDVHEGVLFCEVQSQQTNPNDRAKQKLARGNLSRRTGTTTAA